MLHIAKRGVIRALDFVGYELRKRPVGSAAETDYQALSASLQATVKFADLDPEFLPLMERVRGFTMTSVERMFALYKAVQYIARARIPGDLLECGVWRGGSMMLAAVTCLPPPIRAASSTFSTRSKGIPPRTRHTISICMAMP